MPEDGMEYPVLLNVAPFSSGKYALGSRLMGIVCERDVRFTGIVSHCVVRFVLTFDYT